LRPPLPHHEASTTLLSFRRFPDPSICGGVTPRTFFSVQKCYPPGFSLFFPPVIRVRFSTNSEPSVSTPHFFEVFLTPCLEAVLTIPFSPLDAVRFLFLPFSCNPDLTQIFPFFFHDPSRFVLTRFKALSPLDDCAQVTFFKSQCPTPIKLATAFLTKAFLFKFFPKFL